MKIDFKNLPHGQNAFLIEDNGERIAEMVFKIENRLMSVYHTEVQPAGEGKGIGKMLIEKMVKHAREHHLKVLPLCSYVHAQFRRHPEQFADVWSPDEKLT